MSQKELDFLPGSAKHWEVIANSIADDDNIDGPGNDFAAAYYYFKAAREGRKEKENKGK